MKITKPRDNTLFKIKENLKDKAVLIEDSFRWRNSYQVVDVKCLKCGAISEKIVPQLHSYNYECTNCVENELQADAKVLNFTFMKTILKNTASSVILRCNSCGYFNVRPTTALRLGNVSCASCREIKVVSTLEKYKCKYIRSYYNPNFRNKLFSDYITEDGCFKSAQSSCIVSTRFSKSCENKHWVKVENYVYKFSFVKDNFMYYKIGTAVNIYRRCLELKIDSIVCIECLAECSSRKEAEIVEKALHNENRGFKLNKNIVASFCKFKKTIRKRRTKEKHMYTDGATEWFRKELI